MKRLNYEEHFKNALYELNLKTALIEQHRKWFDYQKNSLKEQCSESIPCPVCDSTQSTTQFTKDLFQFSRCQECGMVYLNPRLNLASTYRFYNEAWTAIYNQSKFIEESDFTRLDDSINIDNLKLIKAARGSPASEKQPKLLELGFGSGFFLHSASKAGFDVYGVDVDQQNCVRAEKHFPGKIFNSDLFAAKFPEGQFDVVYMRDVFEHVPNPKPLLQEISRLLRKGGILFLEVPNVEALIYKVVKERHVCIFGFAHLNYWAPDTLKKVLSLTGFETGKIHHKSLDFTVMGVATYFLSQPFTSLMPIRPNRLMKILSWIGASIFSKPGFRQIDQKLFPWIADSLGRGSEIKVMARKL